jgi:hypothetical protein
MVWAKALAEIIRVTAGMMNIRVAPAAFLANKFWFFMRCLLKTLVSLFWLCRRLLRLGRRSLRGTGLIDFLLHN